MSEYPEPPSEKREYFQTVFAGELRRIEAWRGNRKVPGAGLEGDIQSPQAQADAMTLFGLAFSGGGIRSATFNLGVLQAVAQLKILRYVDYLSTVSGGGYIGGWLNAMIFRRGLDDVEQGLDPNYVKADALPQKAIAYLRA